MKMVDLRGTLKRHPVRKYPRRSKSEISIIAIHHSLTKTGTPQAFANHHVDKNGWPGIAYQWVIQKDGTIYICCDIEDMGYHVGNSNRKSVGICMVGDFRYEKPTEAQYQACLELVRHLLGIFPNAQIKGHSELPGYDWKDCPVISMDQFRKDVVQLAVEQKKEEPKIEPWKVEVLKQAEELGIIQKGVHQPNEPVDKAFVLAVALNVIKALNFQR